MSRKTVARSIIKVRLKNESIKNIYSTELIGNNEAAKNYAMQWSSQRSSTNPVVQVISFSRAA